MATPQELSEHQLGQIQDTQFEQGQVLKKHEGLLDNLLKDMIQVQRDQRESRDQTIRLEESVKGMREQNKSHHEQQIKTIQEIGTAVTTIASEFKTLLQAIGVDVKRPESVTEASADFKAIRDNRLGRKNIKEYFLRAVITVGAGALLLLLYDGLGINIKEKINDPRLESYQNGHQTTIPQLRKR